VDFAGRRQALKLMGLSMAAIAAWRLADVLAESSEKEGAQRRFTGSREEGSFGGNIHPVTSGSDQGKIKLDPQSWVLRVTGDVTSPLTLSYPDILALPTAEVTATLDCTGGWYTVQTWRGIPLAGLLAQAQLQPDAVGIILRGVLDYSAPFLFPQVQEILLATHVGGEVLNHSHGYPLRAVVPSRRGWHWVKWLTEIEVIGAL
jgi:DMSO/TMAO reductase YedYZ molybdopterin-dependent catalytic subunit